MFFASAVVNIIDIRGYLRTQVEHAYREGEAATSVRAGAVPMAGWAHSVVIPDRPRDYAAAFKAVPEHFGARFRKGCPFGLHLLLNVSPAWIREVGDLHDERNERNQRLYQAARDFAGSIPGLVATRMDLDEEGGGEVDVFLAPIFPRTSRLRKDGSRGSEIPEISVSKLDALWREQTSERKGYSGLQTLWAAYCAKHLDPRIQRGERKSETGREHLTVPKFKAASAYAEALVAEAETIMERALQDKAEVEEERRRLAEEAQAVKSRAHKLEREQILLHAENQMSKHAYEVAQAGLEKTDTELKERHRRIDDEDERLTTARHELASTEARLRREQEELAERKQKLEAEEERLARERTEHATRTREADQLIENLRADLERERSDVGKLKNELTSARAKVDRDQQELDIRKSEAAQEREKLDRQSNAQAKWAGALETGVDRIFSGRIPSRGALKEQVDLQPAMDPLFVVFDRFLELHQIAEHTLQEQSAAKRKLKEAKQLFADLAADKVHMEKQMAILSNALGQIGQIQPQLSREDQKKVSEARTGLEQVNVIRRPPPRKPDPGIEM